MSGLPHGSSPRLSGVVHFLKMVEKDGESVPFEVAPAARWTLRGSGSSVSGLFDDFDAEVQAHVAMLVFQNMLDVTNWSDCTSLHLDVNYTDIEGNESTHNYGGVFTLCVDDKEGFHGAVALDKAPFDGKQLRNLLYHLWDKESDDDCQW
jgi:hypothetical protein